jgi:hypothetical protein
MAWFRFKFAQEIENALQQLVPLEAEQGVELFYTLTLSPKVALTANAQWLDPAQAKIPNSLHTGLRLTARF